MKITTPYYLGMCEVTQEEYHRLMGSNPSAFSASARYREKVQGRDTSAFPVESVSWEEATEFCRRLTARGAERNAGLVYRLPTEAEWEYACRAGTTTPFHFGESADGTHANVDGTRPFGTEAPGIRLLRTAIVGSYSPNAFGLYDMHGNVAEWCQDWFDPEYYENSPLEDPPGPPESTNRFYRGSHVVRGGSWNGYPLYARSGYRHYKSTRSPDVGFRVVCVPEGDGRQAAIARLAAIAAIEGAGGIAKFDSENTIFQVVYRSPENTDAHLAYLKGASKLRDLYLPNTSVTDSGLEKHIKGLTALRNLYLPGTEVGDAGLEHLKALSILSVLYLDNTKVTDRALEHLEGLPLVTLSLNGTEVTGDGLEHLAGSKWLYHLHLRDTSVTDDSLVHLAALESVGDLDLSGTDITDAGLEHLKALRQLEKLNLQNTGVTSAGVEELELALPECRIVR